MKHCFESNKIILRVIDEPLKNTQVKVCQLYNSNNIGELSGYLK
jgi:hypothetical protein